MFVAENSDPFGMLRSVDTLQKQHNNGGHQGWVSFSPESLAEEVKCRLICYGRTVDVPASMLVGIVYRINPKSLDQPVECETHYLHPSMFCLC